MGKGKEMGIKKLTKKDVTKSARKSSRIGWVKPTLPLIIKLLNIFPAETSTLRKSHDPTPDQGIEHNQGSCTLEPEGVVEIMEFENPLVGTKRQPEVPTEDLHQRMAKREFQTRKITNMFLEEVEEFGQDAFGQTSQEKGPTQEVELPVQSTSHSTGVLKKIQTKPINFTSPAQSEAGQRFGARPSSSQSESHGGQAAPTSSGYPIPYSRL